MSWIFEGKQIKSIKDIPQKYRDSYGFVYCIVTDTGKEYIGCKVLYNRRSKKVSNKKLREKGKSFFRRKKVTRGKHRGEWYYYEEEVKESNWLKYCGSNKELLKDIKDNGVNVTKFILEFTPNKTLLTYKETKHIFCTGALEEDKFYNDNALGKFYKKSIKVD